MEASPFLYDPVFNHYLMDKEHQKRFDDIVKRLSRAEAYRLLLVNLKGYLIDLYPDIDIQRKHGCQVMIDTITAMLEAK